MKNWTIAHTAVYTAVFLIAAVLGLILSPLVPVIAVLFSLEPSFLMIVVWVVFFGLMGSIAAFCFSRKAVKARED